MSDHAYQNWVNRPQSDWDALLARAEAAEAALARLHVDCHDLVCNGSRSFPRGEPGHCCSCRYRDTASIERDQAEAALRDLRARLEKLQRWGPDLAGEMFDWDEGEYLKVADVRACLDVLPAKE